MPKLISEDEKRLTKQALEQATIALIQRKGLRHVTVADITKAVGMAKGSFYFYFQTKEALLYEAIKHAERKGFETAMGLRFDEGNVREQVERALFDIYLAPDSLALYLKPEDMEYLMRKLPAEMREQEQHKIQHNLAQAGALFGLPEEDWGTLAYLMDALQELASSAQDYGNKNRQRGLEILVRAIAEFLDEKAIKKGR
ncbi:MAG: TetR/AcrR family transcriptional regulator [Oscillospiraceae bacterium]|nr:TetR/AcrR family transcriptional regulator [Oscillospiraceae bacterium]